MSNSNTSKDSMVDVFEVDLAVVRPYYLMCRRVWLPRYCCCRHHHYLVMSHGVYNWIAAPPLRYTTYFAMPTLF